MAHTQRSSLVVFLLLSLLLLSTQALDTDVNLIHVRLADGIDRSSSYLYPSGAPQHPSSTAATKSTIARPPAQPYGPRLLRGLAGEVFSVTEGGYDYKLNMFDSVLQRKTSENEPVLLGVWDRWEVVEREEEGVVEEEGKERGNALSFRMVYTDGATCMANTSVVRTVMVDFLCAASPTPRADDAASAAVADEGDTIGTHNSDDSTGMNLVDQVIKAREEGRVVREGESAAADFAQEVQQQQQQHQQQHLSAATAMPMPTTMETEAASAASAFPAQNSPFPPPQPQEEEIDFRLSDAREPSMCLYHLTLHSPIPCAVFQKELASFAVHGLIKGKEEEGGGGKKGGGTKRQRKKNSKGKKGGGKREMAFLMEGVRRWMKGLWGKAVRVAAKSTASSNNSITTSSPPPSSSSSSSSVCTCPCPVDTAAAAAAATTTDVAVGSEVGEEKKGKDQIEALVHEVGELRSQLAKFLEEMRGGREGGREGCIDGEEEVVAGDPM